MSSGCKWFSGHANGNQHAVLSLQLSWPEKMGQPYNSIIRHQDSFNNSHTVIRLVFRISSDNPVRILLYNPVLGQKVPSTLSTSLALAWLVFL